MEADGLAELAGARRAQTHYDRRCNTERGDEELSLHPGVSLCFPTSGPKPIASGFILKISRLRHELLRLCNDTRDSVNQQHLLAGEATHKATAQTFQTLQFDQDSQAEFTVPFGRTAQNGFKMHMCNSDRIIWIR